TLQAVPCNSFTDLHFCLCLPRRRTCRRQGENGTRRTVLGRPTAVPQLFTPAMPTVRSLLAISTPSPCPGTPPRAAHTAAHYSHETRGSEHGRPGLSAFLAVLRGGDRQRPGTFLPEFR